MKFSNYIPKYSSFKKLLKTLDGYFYGSLHTILQKTKDIDNSLHTEYNEFSIERIKSSCNLSEKSYEDLKFFCRETGSIPSKKDILFAENHGLLKMVPGFDMGKNNNFLHCKITDRGNQFLKEDIVCLSEIDNKELMLIILEDTSNYSESDSIEVDKYFPILNTTPNYEFTQSRIDNLMDRGLLGGKSLYKITQKGISYLGAFKEMRQGSNLIEKFLYAQNDIEKIRMLEWLYQIDPYEFEKLVGQLLQKIGHHNIEITVKSGDGGVDINAQINSGTSTIKEIFQVKRWRSNVQRPTLDQIRGVLSISDASRGTIITTGDFSNGCYNNFDSKKSVTLINGKNLVDLMLKHKLGFSEQNITQYKFTPPLCLFV